MTPDSAPPPELTTLSPHRSHRHAKHASRIIPAAVARLHHERRARRVQTPVRSMHEMTPAGFFIWLWGWIKATAFRWKKAPFPTHRDAPNNAIYAIPDECVIGVAADWGSGTLPAMRVAEGIRSLAPDVTIHMGDVYFCGEPEEYDRLFIGEPPGTAGSWPRGTTRPKHASDALPAYAMNGNHEMCGGGYGIFEHALPALGQKTSYFALENAHWRIVALDSGYTSPPNGVMQFFTDFLVRVSNGLPRANEEWLAEVVFRDPGDRRPVILLSHHQPLSAFEADYPVLRPQLAPYLDRVLLWFWGHEHRLALYERVPLAGGTVRGRCIGHAGMPNPPKYPAIAQSPWTPHVVATPPDGVGVKDPDDGTFYSYCGWLTLELRGADLCVRYYNEDPTQDTVPFRPPKDAILEEVWTVGAGGTCSGRVTKCDGQMLRIWPSHSVNDLVK